MAEPNMDEALGRQLLEATPDAMVIVDEEGRIVLVNEATERLFGYPRAELVGQGAEVLVPELLRAERRGRAIDTLLARPPGGVLAGRRRDGAEIPIDVRLGALSTSQGRLVVATVRDASGGVGRERALRESEERFRLALDEAPIGMAIVGLDGRFVRVNRALSEIVGYSREELTARTFQEITHPDDVHIDVALAQRLTTGEIPRYQLAKRYVRKDGTVADVMLHGSIVRDRDGQPLHYIAQVEDITDRKRSEEALRSSEARFRELFEQLSDGVFIADLSGRYIDVNAAGSHMLGYTRDELLGKTIIDLIPPADVPRLAASREAMLEPGFVHVGEWTLRRKDGEMLPVELTARILPDGRWQAVARDVSERKRAEAALRRSEESLARAQRVAHVGSWEWDLSTEHRSAVGQDPEARRVRRRGGPDRAECGVLPTELRASSVRRSAELYELFGVAPSPKYDEPLAMLELVSAPERESVRRVIEDAIRNGRSYCIEHGIERADGTRRFVLQQGEPVLEQGTAVAMVGTMLDITERKQAELETERSLRRLRTVLSLAPIGIVLLRGAGAEEILLNACAEALMGRTLAARGGLTQYAGLLLDTEGKPVPIEELPGPKALRGEATDALELCIANPERGLVPVLVNAAPIPQLATEMPEAIVAFQDISALKELERLRAEWSSVVAHDLRQPLSAIAMAAELLRELRPDESGLRYLGQIERASRRLQRMIDDLLDSSQLEARNLRLSKKRVALATLARECVEHAAQRSPERSIELHADPSLWVEIDADRIAQVLENLLSNALKYGVPGTPIEVTVRRESGTAVVSVTNEGEKIPADELPYLFRRFQRTAGARESPVKGLGLGLYISRELVEAHGGRITAESYDRRTTFRFALPLAVSPQRPQPPTDAGNGRR